MESFNEELKRIALEKEAKRKLEILTQQEIEYAKRTNMENEVRKIAENRRRIINEQVAPYDKLIQLRLSRLGKETWGMFSLRGSRANLYYKKPETVTTIGSRHGNDTLGFWRNGRINWRGDSRFGHQAINHEDNINKYSYEHGSDGVSAEYYQVEYPMQEGEGYFLMQGADLFQVKGKDLDEGFLKLFKCGPFLDDNPFNSDKSA